MPVFNLSNIETLRRETRRYALLARKARWMRQLADENGPMTPDEAHRTRSYGAIGIKAAASMALLQLEIDGHARQLAASRQLPRD